MLDAARACNACRIYFRAGAAISRAEVPQVQEKLET